MLASADVSSFLILCLDLLQPVMPACSYGDGSSSKRATENMQDLLRSRIRVGTALFLPGAVDQIKPHGSTQIQGGRGQQGYLAEHMDAEKSD